MRKSTKQFIQRQTTPTMPKLKLLENPSKIKKEVDRPKYRPPTFMKRIMRIAAKTAAIVATFLTLKGCSSENTVELGKPKPKPDAGIEMTPDAGQNGWREKDAAFCRTITLRGEHPKGYAHRLDFSAAEIANAKPDRSDIRTYVGTCKDAKESLPLWIENIDQNGVNRVWVGVPPEVLSIAVYYGNPNAESVSDGKNVFLAFGQGTDWSHFEVKNDRGTIAITENGIEFTNHPWGNGSGEALVVKAISGGVSDFEQTFTVQYRGSLCRPYAVVAGLADNAQNDFQNNQDGVAVSQFAGWQGEPCGEQGTEPPRQAKNMVVRTIKGGQAGAENTGHLPMFGETYYGLLMRIQSVIKLNIFATANDRSEGTNPITSTAIANATQARLFYVTALGGFDISNGTRSADGFVLESRVRAIASDPVTHTIGPEEAR